MQNFTDKRVFADRTLSGRRQVAVVLPGMRFARSAQREAVIDEVKDCPYSLLTVDHLSDRSSALRTLRDPHVDRRDRKPPEQSVYKVGTSGCLPDGASLELRDDIQRLGVAEGHEVDWCVAASFWSL